MTKLVCLKNGPILIGEHDLAVMLSEAGDVIDYLKNGPIALCRCGQSNKKPFCDGSHVNGFEAEQVELSSPEDEDERGKLSTQP